MVESSERRREESDIANASVLSGVQVAWPLRTVTTRIELRPLPPFRSQLFRHRTGLFREIRANEGESVAWIAVALVVAERGVREDRLAPISIPYFGLSARSRRIRSSRAGAGS
jgi:hypothetical protein